MEKAFSLKALGFKAIAGAVLIGSVAWGQYISVEPEQKNVKEIVEMYRLKEKKETVVPGFAFVSSVIYTAETLLNKNGGHVSNDILVNMVPVYDNMANWEYGVLNEVRMATLSLRKELSRSQSQSVEVKEVVDAQTRFTIDNTSWMMPAAEGKYKDGIDLLKIYLHDIADDNDGSDSSFFTRADNLAAWLDHVRSSLGSMSKRLSASGERYRTNIDLAGDKNAEAAKARAQTQDVGTPWLKIDDVYWEARGQTWALIHMFKAVEYDFKPVLEDKNAGPVVRNIIEELEATQRSLWSPVVLNGDGFGIFANHSYTMANFISRANAAVIELEQLLNKG
ncbi:DUF2333 family protein [Neptuniibacter sp. QD37_11]|uniref:DUF2333 family protein n=1 Tax=Neptuniibacter sp. QD37_11 TaxID=3398209 RepID=UPI0039F6039C